LNDEEFSQNQSCSDIKEEKMFGWMGKILFLNLTAGNVKEERLDSRVLKDFIGGRGLGISTNLSIPNVIPCLRITCW
jgi:hypothetical protein